MVRYKNLYLGANTLKDNILAVVKYCSIYIVNLELKETIGSSSQISFCFLSVKPYSLVLTPACLLGMYLFSISWKKNNS